MDWVTVETSTPPPPTMRRLQVPPPGEVRWNTYPEFAGTAQAEQVCFAFYHHCATAHDAQVVAAELAEIAAEARCRIEAALAKHAHIDTLEAPNE